MSNSEIRNSLSNKNGKLPFNSIEPNEQSRTTSGQSLATSKTENTMNIKRKVSRLTALVLILTVALMGSSELAAGPLAPDTLYVDDTNA